MTTTYTPAVAERIRVLLEEFRLTSAAEELPRRLLDAGHEEALVLIKEVLEQCCVPLGSTHFDSGKSA